MTFKRLLMDVGRDIWESTQEISKDLNKIDQYDARYFLALVDEAQLVKKVSELTPFAQKKADLFIGQANEAIICSILADPEKITDLDAILNEVIQYHPTDYSLIASHAYTSYQLTFISAEVGQVREQLLGITRELFADISSRAYKEILALLRKLK